MFLVSCCQNLQSSNNECDNSIGPKTVSIPTRQILRYFTYDLWSHVCLIFCYCVVLCQQSLLFFTKSIFDYGNLDQTIAHNNLIVLITLYLYKKTQQTYTHPPPLTHVLTRKREFKGPFFCTYPCYMLKLRCSCLFNYNSCDGTIKSSQK